MKAAKRFDCVEVKNAIQARLVARRRGMSPSEFVADVEMSVMKSTDPIGKFWRKISSKTTPSARPHALAGQ